MIEWENYLESLIISDVNERKWTPMNIACPKCGKPIYKNVMYTLASNPPRYQYKCIECGWGGTAPG